VRTVASGAVCRGKQERVREKRGEGNGHFCGHLKKRRERKIEGTLSDVCVVRAGDFGHKHGRDWAWVPPSLTMVGFLGLVLNEKKRREIGIPDLPLYLSVCKTFWASKSDLSLSAEERVEP